MLSLLSLLPALLPLAASSPLLLPQEQPSQLTFSTSPDPSCLASFLPSLPCLVSHHALSADDIVDLVRHVGSLGERRLVEYVHAEEGDEVQQMWITEGEKALLKLAGRRFWDVTGLVEAVEPFESTPVFPSKLSYSSNQLQPFLDDLSEEGLKEDLTKFTSFSSRYYRSSSGRESQKWLLGHIKEIISTNPRLNMTVEEFPHSWGQNSIILRILPSSLNLKNDNKIVIVGAHQDSTNMLPFLPAPGADDDGSGTVTILAALKSLVKNGYTPLAENGVEVQFHWYSAEEGGLLGSGEVAKYYQAQGWGPRIKAMIQMDMTAWVKAGTREEIGVITDFVDADLTNYFKRVTSEYAEIPYVETKCGYACSDHASWSKIGAPSAFIIEGTFENHNPHIHTSSDRLDISPEFSFAHMKQFARVVVGFVVELGGLGKKVV